MTNPIEQLYNLGQSLWYDNIQRGLLMNGEMAAMIQRGDIRGVTSNPSIFQKAISRGEDYESQLRDLALAGLQAPDIFEYLAVQDIKAATDLFLPLYEESGGLDGYVSLEVNPHLARNTEGTVAEAKRLWDSVGRPNLMVKIPATQGGLPAIRDCLAAGVNINVTLIFSIERYEAVMDAFLEGLEQRLEAGSSIDQVASVASFFVSRVDTKVDRYLQEIIRAEGPGADLAMSLVGKLAVANARLAYRRFQEVFSSERFSQLKIRGAQSQRPLWASTSTKNPNYSDIKYVETLVAPQTVNTVPPETLEAFRDHGKPEVTIHDALPEMVYAYQAIESLGYPMARVTMELEEEGVKAFADSYDAVLEAIEARRLAFLE